MPQTEKIEPDRRDSTALKVASVTADISPNAIGDPSPSFTALKNALTMAAWPLSWKRSLLVIFFFELRISTSLKSLRISVFTSNLMSTILLAHLREVQSFPLCIQAWF